MTQLKSIEHDETNVKLTQSRMHQSRGTGYWVQSSLEAIFTQSILKGSEYPCLISLFFSWRVTPDKNRNTSLNRTAYLSTDRAEYLSPDRTEYPFPDRTEYPFPDRTEYTSPDRTEYPSPDRTEYPSLDRTEYPSPDRTELPSPDRTEYLSQTGQSTPPQIGQSIPPQTGQDKSHYVARSVCLLPSCRKTFLFVLNLFRFSLRSLLSANLVLLCQNSNIGIF